MKRDPTFGLTKAQRRQSAINHKTFDGEQALMRAGHKPGLPRTVEEGVQIPCKTCGQEFLFTFYVMTKDQPIPACGGKR